MTDTERSKSISVPARSLWNLGGLVIWWLVAWGFAQDYLLPTLALPKLTPETTTWADLRLAAVPILSYVLVATGICLVANIFHPLKSYGENGLVAKLVFGLVGGLAIGLVEEFK